MTTEPADDDETGGDERGDGLPGVQRLLALSDGVVAIALTLLVLQLRVPSVAAVTNPRAAGDLATQLAKDADQFASYVISFYVIAQFWLVHHRVFRQIAGQRESLAWWNFAFLFTITIMPFTSDLLGQYADNPLAVTIFALNLLAASLATQATMVLGRRRHLLKAGVSMRQVKADRARALASILVIAVSIGLAWHSTSAAMYCWLLLAVAPAAAERLSRRYLAPEAGSGSGSKNGPRA
ncbi:MAG TPA: TMEM175 family protein [Streptosporangiaceae bacterium]|jgi:uncharacterized membrane protein|nr:TMEM175 family protein [Streptosporangiaceae bacterium]